MAVNKKGSRKIVVENCEFRWRATGSDGGITIVTWLEEHPNCKVVSSVGYHHDWKEIKEGHWYSNEQLVVTNRIVREIILHVGIVNIRQTKGTLNIGPIEKFYNVQNAVRNQLKS